MVTIGMNYFVIPGKESPFEGACAKVVEVMGTNLQKAMLLVEGGVVQQPRHFGVTFGCP